MSRVSPERAAWAGCNDRKYYSLERAKEVLGYDPQDNSAEYTFEGEPKDDR